MSDRRLQIGGGQRRLVLKQERFFPAGTYTWSVPAGCESVDVFLVGGGGGSQYAGGGGGYTKTFKSDISGYKNGDAIQVFYGENIQIIVGRGGNGASSGGGTQGGYSQFKNSSYRANGGYPSTPASYPVNGGHGGSGGGAYGKTATKNHRGSDGGNGKGSTVDGYGTSNGGTGQGYTTRAFGEPNGDIYAYGGYAINGSYKEDVEPNTGNGGNGDGLSGTDGADGTVLIRYYAYE